MTIFANDGSVPAGVWRLDLTPSVNVGPTWQEVYRAWKFKDGEWVQFYGPSIAQTTFGMYSGGSTASGVYSVVTDKCTWLTYTTAAQSSANLSLARTALGGAGNSLKGVFIGGLAAAVSAVADMCSWSNDTTSAQAGANLTVARQYVTAAGSEIGGIYVGGSTTTGNTNSAVADLCTWETVTTSAQVSANLSAGREDTRAVCNKTVGVYAGGTTTWGSNGVATADACTWSTFTTAAQVGANLTTGRMSAANASNRTTFGIFAGGYTNTSSKIADKCTFATFTTATQSSADLPTAEGFGMTIGSGDTVAGIFAGGYYGGPLSASYKCPWGTLTTAAQTSANLSVARWSLAAAQDGQMG